MTVIEQESQNTVSPVAWLNDHRQSTRKPVKNQVGPENPWSNESGEDLGVNVHVMDGELAKRFSLADKQPLIGL